MYEKLHQSMRLKSSKNIDKNEVAEKNGTPMKAENSSNFLTFFHRRTHSNI